MGELKINEVDAENNKTFTLGELVRHPLDTAKYVVAVIPATIDFVTSGFALAGESSPSNVQRVTSSAEKIAAALDHLKEIDPNKVESMQARIREQIAKAPNR